MVVNTNPSGRHVRREEPQMSDKITITVSRRALSMAVAALENLGDANPWTVQEYDEPADEIKDAIHGALAQGEQ